jgi:hypothetical protein
MTDESIEREVRLLRDRLAEQIGRNVELQERVEALERERAEVGLDAIAVSLAAAIKTAEAAMAEEAMTDDGPGLRYAIPKAEVTVRGLVGRRGEGLALRFPGVEQRAEAGTMSSIRLGLARLPR